MKCRKIRKMILPFFVVLFVYSGCRFMGKAGRFMDMALITALTNSNVAKECYFSRTVWEDFDLSQEGNKITFYYWSHIEDRLDVVFYSHKCACAERSVLANTPPTGRVEVVVKQFGKVIYSGIEDLEASYKRGMAPKNPDHVGGVESGCFPIFYLPKASFKRKELLKITLKMITPVSSQMKELMGRIDVCVYPNPYL